MGAETEGLIKSLLRKVLKEDTWLVLADRIISIIIILFVAGIVVKVGKLIIHNVFKVRARSPLRVSERREATLLKLMDNILSYLVYFTALLMVLQTFNIEIKGLLAGAGIAGLAVGFGAQNLVRDVITGFFIIFEDQFSVGDYIRINQFEGTVEQIGLRTTKIRSVTGEIHILPNGTISQVTNFSITNSIAVVDVSISYNDDIDRAEEVIQNLLETLPEKYEEIVNPPQLLGVQSLGPSEVVLRVTAETLPMKHFYISRMLRKEIKNCLDENGIEIPFPHLVMYNRDFESGQNEQSQ